MSNKDPKEDLQSTTDKEELTSDLPIEGEEEDDEEDLEWGDGVGDDLVETPYLEDNLPTPTTSEVIDPVSLKPSSEVINPSLEHKRLVDKVNNTIKLLNDIIAAYVDFSFTLEDNSAPSVPLQVWQGYRHQLHNYYPDPPDEKTDHLIKKEKKAELLKLFNTLQYEASIAKNKFKSKLEEFKALAEGNDAEFLAEIAKKKNYLGLLALYWLERPVYEATDTELVLTINTTRQHINTCFEKTMNNLIKLYPYHAEVWRSFATSNPARFATDSSPTLSTPLAPSEKIDRDAKDSSNQHLDLFSEIDKLALFPRAITSIITEYAANPALAKIKSLLDQDNLKSVLALFDKTQYKNWRWCDVIMASFLQEYISTLQTMTGKDHNPAISLPELINGRQFNKKGLEKAGAQDKFVKPMYEHFISKYCLDNHIKFGLFDLATYFPAVAYSLISSEGLNTSDVHSQYQPWLHKLIAETLELSGQYLRVSTNSEALKALFPEATLLPRYATAVIPGSVEKLPNSLAHERILVVADDEAHPLLYIHSSVAPRLRKIMGESKLKTTRSDEGLSSPYSSMSGIQFFKPAEFALTNEEVIAIYEDAKNTKETLMKKLAESKLDSVESKRISQQIDETNQQLKTLMDEHTIINELFSTDRDSLSLK